VGVGDKLWDALTTVIKMNDRIVAQSEQMKAMQAKIEDLTARVIRLETALEIALAPQRRKSMDRKS
jgi:cell division protein FtsB